MTFDDIARLGIPRQFDPHPEDEVAPPGGISLREALRMVASGRAVPAPSGVAIVTAEGVTYRQREGQRGLVPEGEVKP